MTHRWGTLIQGVVFLIVGVIVMLTPDDRHVAESAATMTVVFAVSALGFVLAWHEWRRERGASRRPQNSIERSVRGGRRRGE